MPCGKNKLMGDNILECDWNKLLPFVNTNSERSRAISINPNISAAVYPLTRDYLNNHYSLTDYANLKNVIKPNMYDCAGAMYSYFLMSFGLKGSTAGNGNGSKPGASGAGISTGFNPFGVINWNLLPGWLWLLLLAAGVLFIKKTFD